MMTRTVKNDIFAGGILILLAFILSLVQLGSPDLKLAGRLRKQVLRFHVIADSNQKTDQDLKLEVRSFLLDKISQGLAEESSSKSKEETADYVRLHKEELEQDTNEFIHDKGFSYEAEIEVGVSHFPTKTYGDMLFPAGDYDAVRVILGKGKGRNWWCVLYPSLCFVNDTAAVVPDSSKQELACVLGEEDYQSLFLAHPDIQFTSRLAQWAKRLSDHLSILPEERP
ncbi:MAG: stage II sporulation protein R [Lachnospiraceae bacterium]|jgi:stage II sporulation protein R